MVVVKAEMEKFKATSIARLTALAEELKKKYPDKADRVDYIVNVLMAKLHVLDEYNLHDYLFTIYLASREFKEFLALAPDEETVRKLLE